MYKINERFKTGDFLRHFRRDLDKEGLDCLYVYVGMAKHTETNEDLAIYKALYGDGKIYARPAKMFYEEIDKEQYPEAKQTYRFEKADMEDLKAIERMVTA